MSEEAYFLTQAVNFLIVGRILLLWTKGMMTSHHTLEAIKLLGVLVLSSLASAAFIDGTALSSGEYNVNFKCEKITQSYWHCGGWPIVWDLAGEALKGLLGFIEPGLGIPASAAGLIAQSYLLRQLSSNINFDWQDLLKFFFWSFVVYLFLFNIDWVLFILTRGIERISVLSFRVDEGKAVLESWLKTAMPYVNQSLDNLSVFNLKFIVVALSVSLVGFVISSSTFIVLILLFILLAFVPLSIFKDVLSNTSDKLEAGIKRMFAILTIAAIKDVNWTVISFFPTLPEPSLINEKIIISGATAGSIFLLCLGLIVVLTLVYGLAIYVGYLAFTSIIK